MGTRCGLFEVRKIGDEYFTYLVDCEDPKACTIVLRGASKDILHEVREIYGMATGGTPDLPYLWGVILS